MYEAKQVSYAAQIEINVERSERERVMHVDGQHNAEGELTDARVGGPHLAVWH